MASTLADYVYGDKKDSFTGFYGQASASAYSLVSDSSGHTKVPTMADVGAAQAPEDKLKLLGQMADVVSIQADAAIATGRTGNVAGMTGSAKDVLSALTTVVSGLGGSESDDTTSQLGTALTSLRTAMDKIATLGGSAAELGAMDDQASKLADSIGATWRRTGTTFRPDASKLVDILV